MRALTLLLTGLALSARAQVPPEVQIALTSVRSGEKERIEAALGPVGALPLYRAELEVDPAKRSVSGKFFITLTPKKALSTVLLRSTPNATHERAVTLSNAKVNGGKVALTQDDSLFTLKVDPPVKPGEVVTFELDLKATVPLLPKDNAGLSALTEEGPGGDYGAFSVSDDVMSLVGVLPMQVAEVNGRRVGEPSGIGDLGTGEPSNFMVSVTAPKGWKLASSGAVLGEIPTGKGTRYAYGAVAARELPLIILKNATVATKQFGEVTVEAVLLSDSKKHAAQVLDDAGKSLQYFESKLSPYPFKTLRVVEMRLVNGAGGMEFPGLVTVSANLLSGSANPLASLGLGDDQMAMAKMFLGAGLDQMMRSTLEFTVAHEVAHQWTAMLIGSDPIADPLADEPLTQHLALLALEGAHGKPAADQQRSGQLAGAYQLHRMLGGADGIANRPTAAFSSNREYAAVMYGKAPLLFDKERALVGDDAWFRSLRIYAEQNRYKWVTSSTLQDVIAAQSGGQGAKVKALRTRWWNETHGDEDLGTAMDINSMMGGDAKGVGDSHAYEELMKQMQQMMGGE